MQSDNSSSNILTVKTNPMTYPFVDCHRLVYNQQYALVSAKYEDLGMEIPEDEEVEKYTKLPFSLNALTSFSFFADEENPNWTMLQFAEIDHLLDINYNELKTKICAVYGIDA